MNTDSYSVPKITVHTSEKPKHITARLKYTTHPSVSEYSAPTDTTSYRLKTLFLIASVLNIIVYFLNSVIDMMFS